MQDQMAEPHEQQTNTALQSHSNQSISRPDADMDQVSNVPNRLLVDQDNTIISLLNVIRQEMAERVKRVEDKVDRVEEIAERVKRVEDKVDRVEDKVDRVEEIAERVKRVEDKVDRVEEIAERVKRVEDKVEKIELECQGFGEGVRQDFQQIKEGARQEFQRFEEGVGQRFQQFEGVGQRFQQFEEGVGQRFQQFEERAGQGFQRSEQQAVQVGEKVEQMGQNFQRLEERVGQVEVEDKQARQDINYIFKDLDFMPIRIHNSGAPENAKLRYPRHIKPSYPPLPHSMQELVHMTDAQRQAVATYLELPALPDDATRSDRWMQLVRYLGNPLVQ